MGMSITNNVTALNTQRWLTTNNNNMSSSLQKLSSGYRINTGADDPAGLIISEQLRAQNAGLEKAVQNSQEAMNVLGIAEGALNEMNSILTTMRELALHASNSGVTSSEQIEADQAEMDSAINTIDRIASTTKYSDTFLLNGSQSLTYDADTNVNSTLDEDLLDLSMTRIDQIYKKDGYSINVAFSGADSTETTADTTKSAQRAYIEATSSVAGTDIDTTNGTTLSEDQTFILSGLDGSKSFSFGTGTHLGDVAESINNVSSSTGVGAQLVYDTSVTGTAQSGDTATATAHATGEVGIFNMDSSFSATGSTTVGVTGVTGISGVEVGKNTDADGRVWVKFTSATEYEVYKDEGMTILVGTGDNGAMSASNNSGLAMTVSTAGATAGDITMLQLGNALEEGDTGISFDDFSSNLGTLANSAISGIRLGENTDSTGNIYVKIDASDADNTVISFYKDSSMSADSLVAQSEATDVDGQDACVQVFGVETGGSGPFSGLYAEINLANLNGNDGTYTGTISSENLGLRLYSTDYGDESFVKVEAQEGALFSDSSGELIDAGISGAEVIDYGQNATVTVNGQTVELNGTSGSVSTSDLSAYLAFDEGELGATTIAVTGYDVGSLASAISEMSDNTNYATQALNNTSQVLDNFEGGMQFQLGEGSGDQERTVYSVQSVAAANLGQTTIVDDYSDTGVEEEKTLSLSDLLGGGYACLAEDPVKALEVIDQAISDVSSLRARLGATQSNLLQTNINSLNVAVENITATESAIRDVDMASETTEFTKNQILVQASTSMLAQANTASQYALSLLG